MYLDYPKKRCFHYWVTNKHFDLTHLWLLVWAATVMHSSFACQSLAHVKYVGMERNNDGAHSDHFEPLQGCTYVGDTLKTSPFFCSTFNSLQFAWLCYSDHRPSISGWLTPHTPSSIWWHMVCTVACNHPTCEGDTETRPLVYEDTLRQGQAEQMWHTDTVVILSSIAYTWKRDDREHTWHSGNPQRSSWGVPTVSATI